MYARFRWVIYLKPYISRNLKMIDDEYGYPLSNEKIKYRNVKTDNAYV